MRLGVCALLVLAGCHELFGLDPVPDYVPDAAIDALDCPGFDLALPRSRSLYWRQTTSLQPWEASVGCEQQGGHLVVIDSKDELDGLIGLHKDYPEYRWWVGAIQPTTVSTPLEGWVWITGGPVGAFWQAGEPNDGTMEADHDEQFAELLKDDTGMRDEAPVAASSLCECDGVGVDPTVAALFASMAP